MSQKQIPNFLIMSCGTKTAGSSTAEKFLESVKTGIVRANIVGIASHHPNGGAKRISEQYKIDFYLIPTDIEGDEQNQVVGDYFEIAERFQPDFVSCLDGYLKSGKKLIINSG